MNSAPLVLDPSGGEPTAIRDAMWGMDVDEALGGWDGAASTIRGSIWARIRDLRRNPR